MPRTDPPFAEFVKKPFWPLAGIFVLMVFLSIVGLDLINRKKGARTYIFAARKATAERISLSAPPMSLQEEAAEAELPEQETAVQTGPDIQAPSSLPAKSKSLPAAEPPPPIESPDLKRKKGKVAIIVDDMGFSLQTIEELCSINIPLTIAILPHSPWAVETAHIARNNGLEVILHLPMESLNDYQSNQDTQGLIHSEMSQDEILRVLEDNLQRVPFIQGVNNHMGSKITAQRELMLPILEKLKEKNLYFVDSLTSGRSVAYQLARQLNIPSAERHVFLDTDPSEESVKQSLLQLFRMARRRGMAVGICHPLEATLKVLLRDLGSIDSFGCQAVIVSEIIH
jgi:polysaccharide deacetylase 2 family uncharacterized protein YibQ